MQCQTNEDHFWLESQLQHVADFAKFFYSVSSVKSIEGLEAEEYDMLETLRQIVSLPDGSLRIKIIAGLAIAKAEGRLPASSEGDKR